ncbi:hypothetical protein MMPV_008128 [Pyropia vietnamensis]
MEPPVLTPPQHSVFPRASTAPSSVPPFVPPSSVADESTTGREQGPIVDTATTAATSGAATDLFRALGDSSMPPLILPLPPRAPQLRRLDTSAVDAIQSVVAAATWLHPSYAAGVNEALGMTLPAICAKAAAEEASHGRQLRQLDAELAAEKDAIEAHVRAFGSTLATRYDVIARGTERRAARQAEVDNVVAYLVRLFQLHEALDERERRLQAAVIAEETGSTASDHADRVHADEMALRDLVAEGERLVDTCPICHERMGGGPAGAASRIRCHHRFHVHCLAGWAESCVASERTPSCPLCRGPLGPPAVSAGT